MLKTYRSLLSIPYARAFVLAGFVARLSISMRALGAVVMISQLTGSYGLAGAVAAAALLGEAAAAPRLGRLVGRYGQRRVLFLSLAVHSIGTLALVISAQLSAPNWVLLATAALSGAAALQVGSLVRARWSALVGDSPVLEAAFALESTLDELIFVLGPALVTALALGVAPGAGLLGALFLTIVGSLALQRRTEPAPAGVRDLSERSASVRWGCGYWSGPSSPWERSSGPWTWRWSRSPARSALPPRPVLCSRSSPRAASWQAQRTARAAGAGH
jgi:MFS family permease